MAAPIFSPKNVKLFWIALALMALGYVLLGQGPVENPLSKTVAPIVLVGVYCVLIPYAIMAGSRKAKDKDGRQEKKP